MLQTLRQIRNRPFIEIFGVLLLAFALRVVALDTRTIWYDDAFSIFLARQDIVAVIAGALADDQPPLYYVLLHYALLFGDSPFLARFLSVILSTLIVALTYATARRRFTARAARNAALFATIAPFQIYHAQEARMYALLALTLLAYVYSLSSLISLTQRGKYGELGATTLFATLALYTHNLAVFTLAAANVYFLFRRDGRALGRLLIAQGIALILFLPWLVNLPTQLAKIERGFWIEPPNPLDLLQTLIEFTTNFPLPTWLLPLALFASLALFALAIFETTRAMKRGAPAALGMLLAFAIVPPVLVLLVSLLFRPVYVTRGIILSSLAYYILLGWLASRLRPRVEVPLILACAILVAFALNYQSAYAEFPRSPYRAADAFLRANARGDEAIVHDNKLSFFPMRYYDPTLAQTFIADPPHATSNTLTRGAQDALRIYPTALEDATTRRSRVWFVIFQRALDEAQAEQRASENKAWLDARFKQISLTQFNDLNVYLYQK